ncbi:MAG: methylated-DNA--[protein]-cysteine S-methyltransferase [Lachnospiraceae bacterium]
MDTIGESNKKGIGRNGKGNEEGFGKSGRRRHERPFFFLLHYIPKKKHGAWQEGNRDNPMKYEYMSPVGRLCIQTDGEYITGLGIDCETETAAGTPPEIVIKLKKELDEYFAGKRKRFTVKTRTGGTPFQEKVWAALRTIPYGEVRSYKDIAAQIGNEKACRAVGGANNKNPLLLLNPCHRVVGADGSPVGFACGVEIKEKLLLLERANGREDGTEII